MDEDIEYVKGQESLKNVFLSSINISKQLFLTSNGVKGGEKFHTIVTKKLELAMPEFHRSEDFEKLEPPNITVGMISKIPAGEFHESNKYWGVITGSKGNESITESFSHVQIPLPNEENKHISGYHLRESILGYYNNINKAYEDYYTSTKGKGPVLYFDEPENDANYSDDEEIYAYQPEQNLVGLPKAKQNLLELNVIPFIPFIPQEANIDKENNMFEVMESSSNTDSLSAEELKTLRVHQLRRAVAPSLKTHAILKHEKSENMADVYKDNFMMDAFLSGANFKDMKDGINTVMKAKNIYDTNKEAFKKKLNDLSPSKSHSLFVMRLVGDEGDKFKHVESSAEQKLKNTQNLLFQRAIIFGKAGMTPFQISAAAYAFSNGHDSDVVGHFGDEGNEMAVQLIHAQNIFETADGYTKQLLVIVEKQKKELFSKLSNRTEGYAQLTVYERITLYAWFVVSKNNIKKYGVEEKNVNEYRKKALNEKIVDSMKRIKLTMDYFNALNQIHEDFIESVRNKFGELNAFYKDVVKIAKEHCDIDDSRSAILSKKNIVVEQTERIFRELDDSIETLLIKKYLETILLEVMNSISLYITDLSDKEKKCNLVSDEFLERTLQIFFEGSKGLTALVQSEIDANNRKEKFINETLLKEIKELEAIDYDKLVRTSETQILFFESESKKIYESLELSDRMIAKWASECKSPSSVFLYDWTGMGLAKDVSIGNLIVDLIKFVFDASPKLGAIVNDNSVIETFDIIDDYEMQLSNFMNTMGISVEQIDNYTLYSPDHMWKSVKIMQKHAIKYKKETFAKMITNDDKLQVAYMIKMIKTYISNQQSTTPRSLTFVESGNDFKESNELLHSKGFKPVSFANTPNSNKLVHGNGVIIPPPKQSENHTKNETPFKINMLKWHGEIMNSASHGMTLNDKHSFYPAFHVLRNLPV